MCVVEVKRPGEAKTTITTACTLEAEDGNCELQSMIQYIGVSAVRTVHKPMTSPGTTRTPSSATT